MLAAKAWLPLVWGDLALVVLLGFYVGKVESEMQDTDDPNSLIVLIDDPDVSVRRTIAAAIGTVENPIVLAPLKHLAIDEAPEVRIAAINVLGGINSDDARNTIMECLTDTA